jgi:hypothetical protein
VATTASSGNVRAAGESLLSKLGALRGASTAARKTPWAAAVEAATLRSIMSAAAKEVLEAALKLDAEDREMLLDALTASLDLKEEDVERAWDEELARRRAKIDRGEAVFHSAEEMQRRVEKALSGT